MLISRHQPRSLLCHSVKQFSREAGAYNRLVENEWNLSGGFDTKWISGLAFMSKLNDVSESTGPCFKRKFTAPRLLLKPRLGCLATYARSSLKLRCSNISANN
jgi:hypothetical protein